MTNVILSFDTEDIINERGADGILRCARILREEGVKGCFNIIGLLPDVLLEWNRHDIFEELSYHEIDYHSHTHSIHPTLNEYTDKKDYYLALKEFIKNEGDGIEKVKSAFNRTKLPAMCVPGNCTSYVAHYGYADLGFDFFSGDDIYDNVSYRPIYCCNTVSLHYARSLDRILFTNSKNEISEFIEQSAKNKHTMVFYHHPQRSICKSFWDADNFNKTNTKKEDWIKSEIHENCDTDRFYENFRFFIQYLKNNPDFKILTYEELNKTLDKSERKITISDLKTIRKQLKEEFFPITTPNSYCISDIFLAAKNLLLGKDLHICGNVYGFLENPYSANTEIILTKDEAIELAKAINENQFLPTQFCINEKQLGPADLLWAFLAFLLDDIDKYTINPHTPWQIDLDEFPTLRDLNYKGSWIHADSLEDNFLSNRLRLQTWTIRLPKDTQRKIF